MTTTLNTEHKPEGIVLTFDDGESAGIVRFTHGTPSPWHHEPPGDYNYHIHGPDRLSLEAAQFDALAWASDHLERKRRS